MRKGWEYKKLGEVCALTMGQSPDGNSINEVNGIEFHQGKTCFGERFLGISPLYSNAPTKLAEAHSVLLCVRAPVGYPNITDRKICIGRGLCALYAKREIDNSFLYYSLLGKQSYFEKNATGSTFKAISSKIVSNTTLSIPPLSTQLAIVSELDKINELIRLKKEQLKDFDNLAQSLFYEMFGDPVENEKGWEVKKLNEIVSDNCSISYGIVQPGDGVENGVPVVRPVDMTKTFVSRKGLKNTTKEISDSYKRTILKGNEILMCVRGTTGLISMATPELQGCNVTRGIAPIECGPTCDKWFVFYQILNPAIQHHIAEYTRGIALKQINMKDVRDIPLCLPPLSLQRLFAQRIEQIEREKSEVQKSIQDLETLLASRMQYWFE